MVNLGQLLGLLTCIALFGAGSIKALKTVEAKTAKMAVQAHKQGYISIVRYHERLRKGK